MTRAPNPPVPKTRKPTPALLAWALFLLVAPVHPAAALDPGRALHHFVLDRWTEEGGLPGNSLTAILQARSGHLWLGTEDGLARFDGVNWVVYNRAGTPGFPSNSILTVTEDSAGRIWVGTDYGAAVLENGRWRVIGTKEGLPHRMVPGILERPDGSVWFATAGGLACLRDGRVTVYRKRDGLLDDSVKGLMEGADGELWVRTVAGVNLYGSGGFRRLSDDPNAPEGGIRGLHRSASGAVWVGASDGLWRRKDGRWDRLPVPGPDGEQTPRIYTIREDGAGTFWLGTSRGLARLAGGRVEYLRREGLDLAAVIPLILDREGNLWFGTRGEGLFRLKEGCFVTYAEPDGLPRKATVSVFEDSAGRLWLSTPEELCRLAGGRVLPFPWPGAAASETALAEDASGRLWLVQEANPSFFRLEGERLVKVTDFPKEFRLPILAVEAFPSGDLWVSLYGNGMVFIHKGLALTHLNSDKGLPNDMVHAIRRDPDGTVWLGTEDGLWRYRDREFTSAGLQGVALNCLHRDRDGALWIGTNDRGVYRLRDGRFRQLTTAEGLYNDSPYVFLDDGLGRLWMGSGKGPFFARFDELNAVADGRAPRLACRAFGRGDGMLERECNVVCYPAAWKTRDGRLCFTTTHGLAVVDPRRVGVPQAAVPVGVERFTADGRPLPTESPAECPPSTRDYAFRFGAVALTAPEHVRLRYRLEGFDAGWVDAGPHRTATYNNLPPGAYSFRVVAESDAGGWRVEAAPVRFTVPRPIWSAWWFQALELLVLALALNGAWRVARRWHASYRLWRKSSVYGRYVVEETLGVGGMGTVFRARDRKSGRVFALKKLHPHVAGDDEARRRFLREGLICEKLDHPNLVRVFERGISGRDLYYVMEYVEGVGLAELVERGGIGPRDALVVFEVLLGILEDIHRAGVCHRDVKPGNIVLGPGVTFPLPRDPEAALARVKAGLRVLDFGLATMTGQSALTADGAVLGTFPYLPPERLMGSSADPRSADFYALGVILYEMLALRKPFPGRDAEEVLFTVLSGSPEPPSRLNPDVGDELSAFCLDLIARDPAERLSDPSAIRGRLEGLRRAPG